MVKSSGALLVSAGVLSALLLGLAPAGASESVIKGGQDPNEWAVYGKDYGNTRFSPLKQINPGNVAKLQLAYSLPLARSVPTNQLRSSSATRCTSRRHGGRNMCTRSTPPPAREMDLQPDMPDDTLQYRLLRRQQPRRRLCRRQDLHRSARRQSHGARCCDRQGALDTEGRRLQAGLRHHLAAAHRRDKIITGFGGGEYGARGALLAFDWIPASYSGRPIPSRHRASPAAKPGRVTLAIHGGGAAWLVGSYDPKTNTVYLGHQQSRTVEYRRPLDRRRQFRQADQPLYRLDPRHRRRHRQDQVADPAARRPTPGTTTASTNWCWLT